MVHIGILACKGISVSAVYGLAETFELANSMLKTPAFTTTVVSVDGTPVKGYAAMRITPDTSLFSIQPDIIILPPVLEDLENVLKQPEIVEWLKEHHSSGNQIATVCAGSFFLAETKLLDGREATTHWNLEELFRQRYPAVNLQIQRLVIDGGDYICCGGVSAWMDLALHLITRHAGRDISGKCAKIMVMDPHREHQSFYGLGGFNKNHGDKAILKVQTWIEKNYPKNINAGEMAIHAALGERTFQRRFYNATGMSPKQYVQRIRIERARVLLETTDLSIEAITEDTGYNDTSTFRKLFKRTIGTTPSSYRKRFSLIG